MGGLFYAAGAKTDRNWSMNWLLSKLWQQQTLDNEAAHPIVRIAWPFRVDVAIVVSPKPTQVERGVVALCYRGALKKSPADERFRRSLPHIRARDALELAR